MNSKFIEIWIDSASLEYVLMLKTTSSDKFEILDPQVDYQVIQVFTTYNDAWDWLREDEYDLVEGRYKVDN